jgi:hypothetical protein
MTRALVEGYYAAIDSIRKVTQHFLIASLICQITENVQSALREKLRMSPAILNAIARVEILDHLRKIE